MTGEVDTKKELITRARELCEAATPGPWCVESRDLNLGDNAPDAQNFEIVPVLDDEPALAVVPWATGIRPDADFIAAARTLVPELADALSELRRTTREKQAHEPDGIYDVAALEGDRNALRDRVAELTEKLSQVEVKPSEYFAAQMADCLGFAEVPKLMGPYLSRACELVTRVAELEGAVGDVKDIAVNPKSTNLQLRMSIIALPTKHSAQASGDFVAINRGSNDQRGEGESDGSR